jgi:hypothetical protein
LKIQLEEVKRKEEVMKMQMMKKEEECEKLEEEVISLRVKVDKLKKKLNNSPVLDRAGFGYIGETSCNADVDPNKRVEEKCSKLPKKRMKKRIRIMQKYSKEGIMVNKSQRGMNTKEIHFQEDRLHSGSKEASIMVKKTTEEKIMINQDRNSEGLHHKEDHSLPGIKVYFMVIVLLVLTLDIKL